MGKFDKEEKGVSLTRERKGLSLTRERKGASLTWPARVDTKNAKKLGWSEQERIRNR